jgi:phospholipid/cholesterol/gamma-HCH transport system substrate-binding protein
MDERVMQFRVGIVVFVTAFITGVLILVFGDADIGLFWQEQYTFQVRFPEAPGVVERTPVRKSGIVIGRVRSVELLDEGGVLVTVGIDSQYRLRKSEVCQAGGATLLGDTVLNFVPSGQPPSQEFIQEGDVVEGIVSPDPFRLLAKVESGIERVTTSVAATSDDVGALARQVRTLVDDNEERVAQLIERADEALRGINSVARNIDSIVQDPQMRADLKKSLAEMPQLFADARNAVATIDRAAGSLDRNMRSLERLAEPLGERGERIVTNADELFAKLGSSAGKVDQLLENLLVFSEALKQRDSTLGRLVNDQELYHNLNDAVTNINRLTIELKPILHDARVFADKIARDPSELGVGGALRRSSGAKPVRPASMQEPWHPRW